MNLRNKQYKFVQSSRTSNSLKVFLYEVFQIEDWITNGYLIERMCSQKANINLSIRVKINNSGIYITSQKNMYSL